MFCQSRQAVAFKRAVRKTKGIYENQKKCAELERLAKHPREWWKMVKRLNVIDNLRDRVDVGKVCDDEGIVRMGKEAAVLGQDYFEDLLNGGEEEVEEVHGGRERSGDEGKGLLGEDITREEVVWALRKLKVKATAGKDGITAEMMNREVRTGGALVGAVQLVLY